MNDGSENEPSDRSKPGYYLKALHTDGNFFSLILNCIPQSVFWKDRNSVYQGCNTVFAKAVGLDDPNEIVGKTDYDLPWPREEADAYLADDRNVIANDTAKRHITEPLLQADGTRLWVDTTKIPLHDDHGNVTGILGIYDDISDRLRAEEALRESEYRYAMAMRAANIGSWDWTISTGELHWSEQIEPMFGFEPGAFGGTYEAFLECVHPDDRQFVIDAVDAAIQLGEGYAIEHRIVWPNGNTRWVSEAGEVYRDDSGTPIRMMGIVQDITERKLAEDALSESRRELETLFSNLPGMAYRCSNDPEWTMAFVSKGCVQLTGYTPEDLINNSTISFGNVIHQDDRWIVWQTVQTAIEKKEPFKLTYRIVTASGEEKWVWEQGQGVFIDDKLIALEGFITDITERKRAEESQKEISQMLKNVLDTIPARVFWKNRKIEFMGCNRLLAEDIGVSSPEEIVGKTDYDISSRERAEAYRADDLEVIESGQPKLGFYERVKTARGVDMWVRTNKIPLRDISGNIIGVLGSYEDITEHKLAEESMAASEARFRAVFEQSPVGIALVEPITLQFQQVNSAFCEMMKRSEEELLSLTVSKITCPEELPRDIKNLEQIASGRDRSMSWDKRYCLPDGSAFTGRVTVVPIRHNGDVAYFLALVEDITEQMRLEQEKKTFYRDTILASTDGKLEICDESSTAPYIENSSVSAEVTDASKVGLARHVIETACRAYGMQEDVLLAFVIAAGEAVTNAVKHAEGGTVYAGQSPEEMWVAVKDYGTGIESLILPSAVLRRGFSTKPSLGLGYSIMLDIADRILLKTDANGTTVVLIKKSAPADASTNNIPDTWLGIKQID